MFFLLQSSFHPISPWACPISWPVDFFFTLDQLHSFAWSIAEWYQVARVGIVELHSRYIWRHATGWHQRTNFFGLHFPFAQMNDCYCYSLDFAEAVIYFSRNWCGPYMKEMTFFAQQILCLQLNWTYVLWNQFYKVRSSHWASRSGKKH